MDRGRLLAVARGDEPADLVFRNARVLDVFLGRLEDADVAVAEGRVAGVGRGYRGREEVDVGGRVLGPGLIDAHVHLESSLLHPREFARALAGRGVTTAITNPHEIANVCGLAGLRWLLGEGRGADCDLLVTLPSCVPATDLATSGAEVLPADLRELRDWPGVVGLGEIMDVAGVVEGNLRILEEMALGFPHVDGHAPGLTGPSLNAYIGMGPSTDHEAVAPEEAREKAARGMRILIREGSAARNLEALLPAVSPRTERRFCLCTDDLSPADLRDRGGVDHALGRAIDLGLDPFIAWRLATLNAAETWGLTDRGAVAPGRRADLVIWESVEEPRAVAVYRQGRRVGPGERGPGEARPSGVPEELLHTVRIDWNRVSLEVSASGDRARVIRVLPGQIVTPCEVVDLSPAEPDPARDLAKLAVIERHRGSGRVGLGFVRGFGLRRGALATTVAHDHHNLMVLGMDHVSMLTAARAVAEAGGGMTAALGDRVLAQLELPVAGLLSLASLDRVARAQKALDRAARDLGVSISEPFWSLSFLGLEVVPELKLTDRGLVDVGSGRVVPLFLER